MIPLPKAMLEVKRLLEELKNKYHNDKESLLLRIETAEQERDNFKVSLQTSSKLGGMHAFLSLEIELYFIRFFSWLIGFISTFHKHIMIPSIPWVNCIIIH